MFTSTVFSSHRCCKRKKTYQGHQINQLNVTSCSVVLVCSCRVTTSWTLTHHSPPHNLHLLPDCVQVCSGVCLHCRTRSSDAGWWIFSSLFLFQCFCFAHIEEKFAKLINLFTDFSFCFILIWWQKLLLEPIKCLLILRACFITASSCRTAVLASVPLRYLYFIWIFSFHYFLLCLIS